MMFLHRYDGVGFPFMVTANEVRVSERERRQAKIHHQRQVVTSRSPVRVVDHFDPRNATGPRRRQETEVDVPRSGCLRLVTVGRVQFVPVIDLVMRVVRADQPEVGERAEKA